MKFSNELDIYNNDMTYVTNILWRGCMLYKNVYDRFGLE